MPWYTTQNPIVWPGKSRINIDKLFDFEIPPTILTKVFSIGHRHCWLVWDPHPSYGKFSKISVWWSLDTFWGSGSDPCSLIKKGFSWHLHIWVWTWKCWVYSQWNSHLIGIMISKTIGFRGTLFSDTPIFSKCKCRTCLPAETSLSP